MHEPLDLDVDTVVSRIISVFRSNAMHSHKTRNYELENETRSELRVVVSAIFEELESKYANARQAETNNPLAVKMPWEKLKFLFEGTFDGISVEAIEGAIQFLALVAAKRKQDEMASTGNDKS